MNCERCKFHSVNWRTVATFILKQGTRIQPLCETCCKRELFNIVSNSSQVTIRVHYHKPQPTILEVFDQQ